MSSNPSTESAKKSKNEESLEVVFRTKSKKEIKDLLLGEVKEYQENYPAKWAILEEDVEQNQFAFLFSKYRNPIEFLSELQIENITTAPLEKKIEVTFLGEELEIIGQLARIQIGGYCASTGNWTTLSFTEPTQKIVKEIMLKFFNTLETAGEEITAKEVS